MSTEATAPSGDLIPSTLGRPGAARFWLAVLLTGLGTGLGAAVLTRLLEFVQHIAWNGSATNILEAAEHASVLRHILVLLGAGLLTGAGQLILRQLSSGNGIDTTAAIWFYAGRMPLLRTLASAVLSIFVVGMGASLGREGAPKQAGAVIANFFSDKERLSDEQRRLLVACGAGAGMAAAYGVPLGGALFSLEVMRGKLALRYVLPALFASLHRHCGFMGGAAKRADLRDSVLFQLLVDDVLGPSGGSDRGSRFRCLRSARPMGRSQQAERLATNLGSRRRVGTGRGGFDLVPTNIGQWQGYLAIVVYETSRHPLTSDAAPAEACRDYTLYPERGPWRIVYAFASGWGFVRRGLGTGLVLVLAGYSSGTFRRARSRGGSGRDHAGADLSGDSDDGADWSRSIFHCPCCSS